MVRVTLARALLGPATVVLLLGGCSGGSHESSQTTTPTPADASFPTAAARAAHAATQLTADVALVTGGCVSDGCGVASSQAFLLTRAAIRPTAPMQEARDAHTATRLADGRVLVTGGFSAEGRPPRRTAELYDPRGGTWSTTGAMSTPRGGHAAALLGRDRVLVAGGWLSSQHYTDSTEIYDPTAGTFLVGPELRDAVDGLAASTLGDGSVLVTGGQSAPGVASDQAVLITTGGRAIEVGPLIHARFKHASVTLDDGRVLILGGTPDDQHLLRSTEYYDPDTQRFSRGPLMTTGRYKLAGGVARGPDGHVVVAGGGRGAEVLDDAASAWRVLPDVPGVRLSFSTVSVLGDTLRILGGYDENIQLTDTDITTALPATP